MSSASLAFAHRFHPDRVRVAGLSAAIALNLVVLLAALRPLEPQIAAAIKLPKAIRVVWSEPPPPPAVPPPPIELKALPKPVTPPVAPAKPVALAPPVVTLRDVGTISVPTAVTPTLAPPTVPVTSVAPAPVEASLGYLKSPIRFPTEAVRRHLQGTVLLRVLVDENGKPVDVVVERSSGSQILDRSARAQVLAGWQFQPAVVDGQHVKAYARVPVTFNLREL